MVNPAGDLRTDFPLECARKEKEWWKVGESLQWPVQIDWIRRAMVNDLNIRTWERKIEKSEVNGMKPWTSEQNLLHGFLVIVL